MRLLQVGFIFTLFLSAASAFAQVSGTVESIGFDGCIRPDTWTPMVVTVTPETGKADRYQIHVKLQDMDRDLPIYQREISVTGGVEGSNRTFRYRMYFMPPPTEGGLPDNSDPGAMKILQEQLRVSLHSSSGKWICDLPITGTVHNVDPRPGPWGVRRGSKLIAFVTDGRSRAIYRDSTSSDLLGVLEDVEMVTVHPGDLPESVLGYDAVDAVVWLDADPASIMGGDDDKYRALDTYVRRGGKLVICHPADWQKLLAMDSLLPVTVEGVEEKKDLSPLLEMSRPPENLFSSFQIPPLELRVPFSVIPPPYRFARAKAKPNAVVDEWIRWKADDVSPYLVRAQTGLGEVIWVAQDLGDPSLTRTKFGWVYVWNRVFDWKNSPIPVMTSTPGSAKQPYEQGTGLDIGPSVVQHWMDLQSKSAWLITLAVMFFIGYWLLAGPGTYAYLAAKNKTQLSWFFFGASAFLATALTVVLVKLVLRGPPELKHLSLVRMAPGQPAVVTSRFGLYIPRDGYQNIELRDATPQSVTDISAFPIHPVFLHENDVPNQTGPEYDVPIVDQTSSKPAAISVKYRSTLKKFQATWVGDIPGAVTGSAKLIEAGFIEGHITNGTNQNLHNVYIVFNYPGVTLAGGGDWILFLPNWDATTTLNLNKEFNGTVDETRSRQVEFTPEGGPRGNRPIKGRIDQSWEPFWIAQMGGGPMTEVYDDSGSAFRKSLAILSLFDRLSPVKNPQTSRNITRVDLVRHSGRMFDISQAVAAGSLVVLAEASGPIPMPLYVEGEHVTGDGMTLYQFVLPLDRSALPSTTQPTTEPGQ